MTAIINQDAAEVVVQKGRISIDIADLRDDIDSCRSDAAWSELPMSAKIRVLIKERIDQLRRERENKST